MLETAAVSVNRRIRVQAFHYLNTSFYAGKRVVSGRKTVDSFYGIFQCWGVVKGDGAEIKTTQKKSWERQT